MTRLAQDLERKPTRVEEVHQGAEKATKPGNDALRPTVNDFDMPSVPWHLPWLRLHLGARELLKTSPASPDWPEVKRELVRCAELRRMLLQAGWFN